MVFYSVRSKFIFFYFPTILFILIPFFLIIGPFLSDLAISLISIIFLIYCSKEKNFSFFKNKYFFFFLFFWFYLLLNTFINNLNAESLKISFFYFRYGVFVIAIITFLKFDYKFVKYFFYCIFLCFLSLIIDGFYQFFIGKNIFGLKSIISYRVSSFFGDELILGSYISRLWPLFFALSTIYLNKKDKKFYLFIIIFILSETLIFISGDRSAFFYINLSAVFIILFSKGLFKLRLLTLISSFFLILIISFINPSAKERVVDQTLKQMNLTKETIINDEIILFSKQHSHHYITAYKMFLDNKVLGVGVKNFRNFCSDIKYEESELSCSTHPHNTYIQILSETGIIGFLFLIIILFLFLKSIFNHLRLKLQGKYYFSDFQICILSGVMIYLWPFIPTGNFFNNWLNIIMILNLPFLIWDKKSNRT